MELGFGKSSNTVFDVFGSASAMWQEPTEIFHGDPLSFRNGGAYFICPYNIVCSGTTGILLQVTMIVRTQHQCSWDRRLHFELNL